MTRTELPNRKSAKAKGKWHYIFVKGMLGWGFSTAILYTIIDALFELRSFAFDREFLKTFIISMIVFPLGGILVGYWIWKKVGQR